MVSGDTPARLQTTQLLADAWRILGRVGIVDTIFNHISICFEPTPRGFHLLMNSYGLMPSEVRPENVREVPLKEYSSSDAWRLGINPDGLQLHGLIHLRRMKPGAVIHLHSPYSIAVGCSESGLLPMSQTAIEFVGSIVTIGYSGAFRAQKLSEEIESLAIRGGTAFLRNHGALVVSDSIQEALYLAIYLEEACRLQVLALSQGVPLVMPDAPSVVAAHGAMCSYRSLAAGALFDALRRTCLGAE